MFTVNFKIENKNLNDGQKNAVRVIADFLADPKEVSMALTGYAGTGKTFLLGLISAALRALGVLVGFCAPTNMACVVMASKGVKDPKTVQALLYDWEMDPRTKTFECVPTTHPKVRNGVIIVDEASMMQKRDVEELLVFASRWGNKVIFVGDPGQLPPVGEKFPTAFQRRKYNAQLTQVMRQQGDAQSIVDWATAVRSGLMAAPAQGHGRIERMSAEEAFQQYVQKLRDGKGDSTAFVVFSNDARVGINQRVRSELGLPIIAQNGEKFMAVNNTVKKFKLFANGQQFSEVGEFRGEITMKFKAEKNKTPETIRGQVFRQHVDDVKGEQGYYIIVLPNLRAASVQPLDKVIDGDEDLIRALVCENKWGQYLNPSVPVVFATYAYAMTCHKAQGSQWETVYLAGIYRDAQWLYTAITRAAERMVVTTDVLKSNSCSWNTIMKAAYGEETVVETSVETVVEPVPEVKPEPVQEAPLFTVEFRDWKLI